MSMTRAIVRDTHRPMVRSLLLSTSTLTRFAVNGVEAALALDFIANEYRTGNSEATFADAFTGTSPKLTYSTSSNSTMVNSAGNIVWAPHNLLANSEDFTTWFASGGATAGSPTLPDPTGSNSASQIVLNTAADFVQLAVSGLSTTAETHFRAWVKGTGTVRLGNVDAGSYDTITLTSEWRLVGVTQTPSATTRFPRFLAPASGGVTFEVFGAHLYRSDLGGMAQVPGAETGFETYVPTNGNAEYLPRVGHHVYNGSAWVNEGLLIESEPRTNLLLNSSTLSTQSVTVAAAAHTLSFTGTGTITLSGVSTDGPLVGTGTGEGNRVSLTFTPPAGSLTLTVSGTVNNAQFEAGSTPSSYIPTSGGTYTRAAQTLNAHLPTFGWNASAVSVQMNGRISYADQGIGGSGSGGAGEAVFYSWKSNISNYAETYLGTDSSRTGMPVFNQKSAGTRDFVLGGSTTYSPGTLVPFNIAARHGSTFVNGAADGSAYTVNNTPVSLPDLSATDLQIAFKFMGTIKLFRQFADDIGDDGLEEATT